MQQFLNFLLRQRGEGQNGSHFHCSVINQQSTAQTSLVKVSNVYAVFYPFVACCLNQTTRQCELQVTITYRLHQSWHRYGQSEQWLTGQKWKGDDLRVVSN